MKEKFLANLGFLVIINLIIKPFYIFGIDRTVQVRVAQDVGEGSYGLYFELYSLSVLFYILLDLGITDYNKREIAQHPERLSTVLPNFLLAKSLLAGLYFTLLFAVALLIGYGNDALAWLWPLALNQLFISLIFYFRSNLAGLLYFKLDGFFMVLDRLLMIFICGFLLWSSWVQVFKVEYFIYASTTSYGLSALLSGAVSLYYAGFPALRFDKSELMTIIKGSLPLAILVLMMSLYNRFDTVMLGRMLPDGNLETNIYAYGYRMLDAVQGFAMLFAVLLLPMFARMIQQKDDLNELVQLSFKSILVFSVSTALACFFFRNELFELLYHKQDVYAANVFAGLLFSFVSISTVYIFGTLLTANKSLWHLNIIAVAGVVCNFVLNFIFIPEYKALGATLATLVTQALMAILQVIWCIKLLDLKFPRYYFLNIAAYAGISAAIFYVVRLTDAHWMIQLGMAGVMVLAAAVMSNMIDWRETLKLLKSRKG